MSELKFIPLGDRVCVRRIEETTSAGGIFIPPAGEKPSKATVVAVGPGKAENGKIQPLTVKVGDTVVFTKYSGTEVKLSGEELLVMREDDIMGIVETA